VLPFLVVAGIVVFLWTRRLFGDVPGVVATLLFTTLPPVLAHSGIATTDVALTGSLALSLYAFWCWLEHPTSTRGFGLGLAVAAAVLSKLSSLLFLPAAGLALALCHRGASRGAGPVPRCRTSRLTALRVGYLSAIIAVWAGYRFSIGPLVAEADRPLEIGPETQEEYGGLYRTAYAIAQAPVYPAPEFFQGLSMLYRKNQAGQKAYLLGEVRSDGWWYFFPVALAVKTPVPFLLLFGTGLAAVLRMEVGVSRWRAIAPAAAAAALLLVSLPSRINIGLRHVLPMYALMAVLAGLGAVALWRWRKAGVLGPAAAGMLIAWQVAGGIRIHPDYLAYFNELAGRHPERILVDSDLDNGQDLRRLADTLRSLRVTDLALAYAGSATVAGHGLPRIRWLVPHEPDTGWVAASLWSLKLGSLDQPGHDDFAWLERYTPFARVGTSIRLYRIPSSAFPSGDSR
jgi:4-amino-4-deoxy-L-arabinose transferase-like glycosyltransferase